MSDTTQVVSPCISVCDYDEASGECRGCYRTAAEAGGWRFADDDGRMTILRHILQRWRDDTARHRPDHPDHRHWLHLGERLKLAGLVEGPAPTAGGADGD